MSNSFLGRQAPSFECPLPLLSLPQILLLSMTAYNTGISLWSFCQLSLLCPLPTPCPPQLHAGRAMGEPEISLVLYKHCFATTEKISALVCYHPYFHNKSKIQHHMNLYKENLFYARK